MLYSNELRFKVDKLKKKYNYNITINKYNDTHNNPINNISDIDTKFINYINNSYIKQIDKVVDNLRIYAKRSININKKIIINGFEVFHLKQNKNIYRCYRGFIYKKEQDEFYKKHKNSYSYLSDKYIVYDIARRNWGGVCSYKIIKDIFLIDFFNINNIKKLIDLSYIYIKDIKIRNKFIYYMRLCSGYNMSFEKQIIELNKKKHNIDVFDENATFLLYQSPYYCDRIQINNLNPLDFRLKNPTSNIITIFDYINDIILKYIINNIQGIHGLYKLSINSNFLSSSATNEEIILKGDIFINNLIFDKNDPICWVNYNLIHPLTQQKLNYDNIHLTMSWTNENLKFNLFEFYNNNNNNKIVLDNNNYIFSYNVHMFINLSARINKNENINNIINLLNYYKNNINIIFLQEVELNHDEYTFFINKMKELDYTFLCKSLNGDDTLYIFLFIKNNIINYNYNIIDTTMTNKTLLKIKKYIKIKLNTYLWNIKKLITPRKQIILTINSINICNCHLNIGFRLTERFIHNHSLLKKINSFIRIKQLKKILKYKPHYIIGDFNFTINDDEHLFLIRNNYFLLNNNNDNSTPYNRVDHIYSIFKNDTKLNNLLLKVNYSDHLPILFHSNNIS